jgi:1,4-dihydroxy-2-naphthoate octaprenyltransferase
MSTPADVLSVIEGKFSHAVIAFLDPDGYPLSVAADFQIDADRGIVTLSDPPGAVTRPPEDREVTVTFSHIRPQPGMGYDERRYVSLWGRLERRDGRLVLTPEREQHWDEQEMTFFEFAERGVGQAQRYLEQLSKEQGHLVKPKLSAGWLFLRATRLPFLTATFVPVALGIAVAARGGPFRPGWALLTLLAAALAHLGVNVANDVFDTTSGADAANVTPTQFSGGSRVILYGLVSLRGMVWLSVSFFAGAIALGLYMAVARGFWPLFWIGVAGVLVGVEYTAPPLRLVHRGLGEIAVALGFGPIMVLGAFFVQAQHLSWEAFYASLPVAILIALVLYANEIPDRPGDAAAGKRTLPVRFSQRAIVAGYRGSTATAFALIAIGAVTLLLPIWALAALITIPMAIGIARALDRYYDSPYELMAHLGTNVQLHLYTGLLLIAGYVVADLIAHLAPSASAWLR